MKYTIKEVAEKMNLSISTLRYYDKEGLLPFVERSESGYRIFSDSDLVMLASIEKFKQTGMPIKEIRTFCNLIKNGDGSLAEIYKMLLERKKVVEEEMVELQKSLDLINAKCSYCKETIEAGNEDIHTRMYFNK
jgi:DNA-binding transcriptional MerR regulator